MSVSPTSTASECTDVVKACDKALADQDKVINLKTRQIEVQQDIIAAQDTRIVNLEKEKSSIFSNPWFYFGVGVLTGAFVIRK
jgi:hypothetical protein